MKTKIVFATNNKNKLQEVQNKLNSEIQLVTLEEIGCYVDIPETSETIEGNAIQKAQYIWDNYKLNCFADDTGLCIEALDGRPGIFSARYAGPQKNATDNMNKVLDELKDESNRNAFFQTTIALIIDGKLETFTGVAKGKIRKEKSGSEGFGYDPIFEPEGYAITFSEMTMEEKNRISHRGKAVSMLTEYIKSK